MENATNAKNISSLLKSLVSNPPLKDQELIIQVESLKKLLNNNNPSEWQILLA